MKEIELRALIQHVCADMGSEEQLLMIGSAPVGQPANQRSAFLQDKVIEMK
jgi:hypothetical protein